MMTRRPVKIRNDEMGRRRWAEVRDHGRDQPRMTLPLAAALIDHPKQTNDTRAYEYVLMTVARDHGGRQQLGLRIGLLGGGAERAEATRECESEVRESMKMPFCGGEVGAGLYRRDDEPRCKWTPLFPIVWVVQDSLRTNEYVFATSLRSNVSVDNKKAKK